MKKINFNIPEFKLLKKMPSQLSYIGDIKLLNRHKVSIVGTRRPIEYTKSLTALISSKLSANGVCIVSGGAMGVDAIAHINAGYNNTIAVMPSGLNHRYPKVNENIIKNIEQSGLTISQFEPNFRATPWSFVSRNELVVALGDILIVTGADIDSGSMRSIEFALKMNKKIYVLPHRQGDSDGTNMLIFQKKAELIYDIDKFIQSITKNSITKKVYDDEILEFCKKSPTLNDAIVKFGQKINIYELEGKIKIIDGRVKIN